MMKRFSRSWLPWLVAVLLLIYVGSYVALSWQGKRQAREVGAFKVWSFDPGTMNQGRELSYFIYVESSERDRLLAAVYWPLLRLDELRGYKHIDIHIAEP
jgi:hypothetical protein